MIGNFLVAYFATKPAIVALVGTRVNPLVSPTSNVYPRLTYFVVDEGTVEALKGPSGLTAVRVQIDAFSRSYGECQTLARLIKGTKTVAGLDGYRGTLGGITVQASRFQSRRDEYDPPATATEFGVYRSSIDFTIWHEE